MKSKILFLILMLCFSCGIYASNENKVLVVSSYGSDYKWSNDVVDAINYTITSSFPGVELNVEYLSSEMFAKTDNWVLKMETILSNYTESPPIAIVLISDEAWMAYRGADTDRFKDVPLILCAVKPHTIGIDDYNKSISNLKLSDFDSTQEVMKEYKATGILRQMNIDGFMQLMCDVIPNIDNFVVVTDKRFYGIYTQAILKDKFKSEYAGLPIKYISALNTNTDMLIEYLSVVENKTGLLLTSWLTGEHGFVYSKDYLYKYIGSVSNAPIFITNDIGLSKGYFIGGYFNDAKFWGDHCGQQLTSIIMGAGVHTIPVKTYRDLECHIDWKVAQKFKLDHAKFPSKVIFLSRPESVWVKYHNYIIFAGILLFLTIASFIYLIRNHLKLQRSQKMTLTSVELANVANTKLREARRSLIAALEKSKESDKFKSAFISNMSHEIRTPLNAIVGFSSIIATIDSEQERVEFSKIIQRNSDLLLQLISDILDISKLESGVFDFYYDNIDACSLCMDVVVAQQAKCAKKVELIFNNPQQKVVLHSDANYISQVLTNFMLNAIKFTHKGTIEIGCLNYNDQMVEFYVKDSGIGIEQDKVNTIFDRFVKINSYAEGTGLGLSLCKTIADILDGEIGVESEFGVGSRFWFRLKKQNNN